MVRRHKVLFDRLPVLMGILNVTPDSFSDGGHFLDARLALEHARGMLRAGATIIDVGGESTRPGAAAVDFRQQCARVIPIIQALVGEDQALVSVDTSAPEVMRVAVQAGAVLINDVRALQSPGALECVAELDAAVCLMHMQGSPKNMQDRPHYQNVVSEVIHFLQQRIVVCEQAGIARSRLIVDPGFGFGKTLAHNLALFQALPQIKQACGVPLLVGVSRKSMLGAITGANVEKRLYANVASTALAVQAGADIIRVHDVAPNLQALQCVRALCSPA